MNFQPPNNKAIVILLFRFVSSNLDGFARETLVQHCYKYSSTRSEYVFKLGKKERKKKGG